ncbi:hypothetical protein SUDANB6_03764 [Streptomyces sp. enrichment culture]
MSSAVIAQGRDYRETFQEFRPGFDLYEEREKLPTFHTEGLHQLPEQDRRFNG